MMAAFDMLRASPAVRPPKGVFLAKIAPLGASPALFSPWGGLGFPVGPPSSPPAADFNVKFGANPAQIWHTSAQIKQKLIFIT